MGIFASPVLRGLLHVTSPYGPRTDPVTGAKGTMHHGLDLRAAVGTEVLAPDFGVVTACFFDDKHGGGNTLLMTLTTGHRVGFCHLASFAARPGQEVEPGEVVALSGNTGSHTTKPHLHVSMKLPGASTFSDPAPLLLGAPRGSGGGIGKLVVVAAGIYLASKGLA